MIIMKTPAINETLAGALALTCALAVFLATAFDASAGLGPAGPVDSRQPAGVTAPAVSP
jgi:hypothetical protein